MRGDGIAKIDGFVIFVAGGTQGQSARIKVTQVSNRYARGSVVEGSGMTAASEGAKASGAAGMAEEMEAADE